MGQQIAHADAKCRRQFFQCDERRNGLAALKFTNIGTVQISLQRELGTKSARIRIIPVCQADLKDMWVLDQYHPDEPPEPEEKPRLKVLTQEA